MSGREEYERKTEELLLPILSRHHFDLVDVEYVKEAGTWFLRVYIDKEGGITINDCEEVAREMNPILDELDYIDASYTFEVSSPGLCRPLKKEKDYVRNLGKDVEIRTYRPIQHAKKFCGTLQDFDKNTVTIVTKDDVELSFAKSDIALIRQAPDF